MLLGIVMVAVCRPETLRPSLALARHLWTWHIKQMTRSMRYIATGFRCMQFPWRRVVHWFMHTTILKSKFGVAVSDSSSTSAPGV